MIDVFKVIDKLIDDTNNGRISWGKCKQAGYCTSIFDKLYIIVAKDNLLHNKYQLLFRESDNMTDATAFIDYFDNKETNTNLNYKLQESIDELYDVASNHIRTNNLEKFLNVYLELKY